MLNENDRLTHEHANGWFASPYSKGAQSKYWTNATKTALMNRLGEYEDTGYSQEEIRAVLNEPTKLQIKTTISNIDKPVGIDEEQFFAVMANIYYALARLYGEDIQTYSQSEGANA